MPFSRGEQRVLVPPDRELDAIQQALLIERGVDVLATRPASYYDTAILYPDRHQLRGTEPLLGFVLAGVPLKEILRMSAARTFETIRWLVVFASLAYGYLWLRLLGVSIELAAAGAIVSVLPPVLLGGIERLQMLSMPLLLAALYHGVRLARGAGIGDAAALMAWTALYPLFGMINAIMALVAVLFVLPGLARAALARHDPGLRRVAIVVLAAVAIDAALLAPWLLDRSDLAVYASSEFLAIKHWQAQPVPMNLAGLGGWWQPAFRLLAPIALLVFYLRQYRTAGSRDADALTIARFGTGLGLFLGVMSFGPVYASNAGAPSTYLVNGLLVVLPTLKALREFNRFWPFGMVCLSISAALWLGLVMKARPLPIRLAVCAALSVAALAGVVARPLAASERIEAPKDFLALASRSGRHGALYVHPYMKWNTLSGVWMIPASKALARPIVNGYLGIEPPWFGYASRVLHRFPDPEAYWLLRAWKVDTVVSLVGELRGVEAGIADKTVDEGAGVIYEVNQRSPARAHPSAGTCGDVGGSSRLEVSRPRIDAADNGVTRSVIEAPPQFLFDAIELTFAPSVTTPIPPTIDVYSGAEPSRTRLNEGMSGAWLESLAADALLHRRRPTALLRLGRHVSGAVEIVFHQSATPLVDSVTLCGSWADTGASASDH